MRGKKFGFLPCVCSIAGALLGLIINYLVLVLSSMDYYDALPSGRAVIVGFHFVILFVFGFAGMQLGLKLDKKYQVQRPRGWMGVFALTCVLLFGIGFGGQYLFMYSKKEVTKTADVDMVLVLDASGSMKSYGFEDARTNAASQFVDSLSQDTQLQVISFAASVMDSTQLVPMDAANKSSHKAMIAAINSIGGTDFNDPLDAAKKTLDGQGRQNCNKAVILLTDGDSSVNSRQIAAYKNSGIYFFSVRIWRDANLTKDAQALVDFAQATGGFDTLLIPMADGSVDTTAMLDAFKTAFKASSSSTVDMRDGYIFINGSSYSLTVFQYLISAVVIILCAMLVGFGYFGTFNRTTIIIHAAMGLVAAVLTFILDGILNAASNDGYYIIGFAMILTMYTAFVFYDLSGEERFDV